MSDIAPNFETSNRLSVSFSPLVTQSSTSHVITWTALVEQMRQHAVKPFARKEDIPLFTLTDASGGVAAQDVRAVHGIGLDYDGITDQQWHKVRANLARLGCAFALYTSHGSGEKIDPKRPEAKTRCRVLIPFDRALTGDALARWSEVWRVFAEEIGIFDAKHAPGTAEANIDRRWYMPATNPRVGPCYFESGGAEPMPLAAVLAEADAHKAAPTNAVAVPTAASVDLGVLIANAKPSGAERSCPPGVQPIEHARALCETAPPAVEGDHGHTALFNLACDLVVGLGLEADAAAELAWEHFNPRCQPPWNDRQRRDFDRKFGETDKSTRTPGYLMPAAAVAAMPTAAGGGGGARYANALPLQDRGLLGVFPKCDDIGNGERLLLRFGHGLKYVHARRKWLIWTASEGRWVWDDGPAIDRLAQHTARQIHVEASETEGEAAEALAKWAIRSADARSRSAMIKSAASHCAIEATDLDRDPNLLNCANGTLDLRTGALRGHDPSDLLTRSTGLHFDPNARHELWDRVLLTATGGDLAMQAFLQRVAGYCTTGYTTEKHFFFIYSEKHDTSKSTYCDALRGALGDYAQAADFGTWLEQQNGGNRGDVVRLMGARLVISVEVEENAKFNAKLLKAWTGGDEITAAAKYEADVSFRPQGKITLAANAAPKIRHSDRPLFERCIRIPFDVQIPPAQQDKSVKARLLHDPAVRAAVLAWCVTGARAWAAQGLAPPPRVVACSRAYRAESDWLATFLRERGALEADAETPRGALRSAVTGWFAERGLRPPSATNEELAKRLAEYGVTLVTLHGTRSWRGVRLLQGD